MVVIVGTVVPLAAVPPVGMVAAAAIGVVVIRVTVAAAVIDGHGGQSVGEGVAHVHDAIFACRRRKIGRALGGESGSEQMIMKGEGTSCRTLAKKAIDSCLLGYCTLGSVLY